MFYQLVAKWTLPAPFQSIIQDEMRNFYHMPTYTSRTGTTSEYGLILANNVKGQVGWVRGNYNPSLHICTGISIYCSKKGPNHNLKLSCIYFRRFESILTSLYPGGNLRFKIWASTSNVH